MCIEFDDARISYVRQTRLPALYKGRRLGEYRIDLIVEDLVIVVVKAVERDNPLFEAQVLTYLRVTGKTLGLLINFNSRLLKDGVRRIALRRRDPACALISVLSVPLWQRNLVGSTVI